MGFSLVYRTMGLVNFAHGNVVMIGAYIASTFYLSAKLPFALAMVGRHRGHRRSSAWSSSGCCGRWRTRTST